MAARFLIAALCAAAASAQGIDKTFYFTHDESPQNLQTIVNVVRAIGDIKTVSVDVAKKAITVSGTADQLAVADWLCHELSQPGNGQPPHEYRIANADPPVVRVYYLANVITPAALQEVTNATRSITDIQRAFPYAPLQALVIRGTVDQIAAADWLLRELNKSGPTQTTLDFPLPGLKNEVARVFYVKNTLTPQALQDAVNCTRSVADIQRFFPYNAHYAIVARGSAEQMALAGWLLQQLDQPTRGQTVTEYRVTGAANPVVRVFYLANTATPQALQQIVNEVRSSVNLQRVFPNNLQNALAVRGTADQISRAELLIRERDK